jgi:hypothetical protein
VNFNACGIGKPINQKIKGSQDGMQSVTKGANYIANV